MNDVLAQLKTAKTFGLDDRPMRMFAVHNRGIMDATLQMGRRRASASALFEVGATVMLCAMVYVLVALLALPAASVLIALLIFSRLMPHLQSGHRHFRELAGMLPAFAIVMAEIRRCEAAAERTDATDRMPVLRDALRFAGVTFSHVAGGAAGVRDVDLAVPAGKVVALVGPSGAGKSTIVDLAMGLLLPQAGAITVDAQALTGATAPDWRRRIGYVAQDAALLNLSIRENMQWADPDADDGAITAALAQAGVEARVRALPQGLDSVVGERGVLFSQGERQRLALARALLRRPSLLVLDEATNGLDAETEAAIMQRLTGRAAHMTVLIVAHRLSTIRCADLIYAVEAGRVTPAASWDELARREQEQDGRRAEGDL
jgi:ATP-binding cassette subfamily C protein